jgi:hypothetical protein
VWLPEAPDAIQTAAQALTGGTQALSTTFIVNQALFIFRSPVSGSKQVIDAAAE